MTASLIFKNTFWQILGKGVEVACSLGVVSLLTRSLGVDTWGNYVFLTTTVLLFFNLAEWGVGAVSVRSLVQEKKAEKVLSNVFWLKFFLSLASFILFNLAAIFLPQFNFIRAAALIASLNLFFLNVRTGVNVVFMAEQKLLGKVFFEVISSLLFLSLVAFFVKKGHLSLVSLSLFWVFSAAVSALAAFFWLVRKKPLRFSFSLPEIKKLFWEATPLGVRQLIFATYDAGIDNFFLKTFLGPVVVGYYGLAYKIYGNLVLLAAFFMNSLFPVLAEKGQKKRKETFFLAAKLLLGGGIIIALITFLGAPFWVEIIGGARFSPSVPVLRVLSLSLIFAFLNHLVGYTMIAQGKQGKLLRFSLVAIVVNLAGNWFFIPRGGILAAAAVTAATELIVLILGGWFILRGNARKD